MCDVVPGSPKRLEIEAVENDHKNKNNTTDNYAINALDLELYTFMYWDLMSNDIQLIMNSIQSPLFDDDDTNSESNRNEKKIIIQKQNPC